MFPFKIHTEFPFFPFYQKAANEMLKTAVNVIATDYYRFEVKIWEKKTRKFLISQMLIYVSFYRFLWTEVTIHLRLKRNY